jgi:replicative DNA helicase
MVMFIHRPEYYGITQDADGNSLLGVAEIIIAKHRNGSVGDVQLAFKASLAKFSNLEEVSMGTMPEDFSEGKKESIYRSKMNYEPSSGGLHDFPSSGFGAPGDNLTEGQPF